MDSVVHGPLPGSIDSLERFMSRLDFTDLCELRRSSSFGEYVLDELLAHGYTELDSVMFTFCRLTNSSDSGKVRVAFSNSYDFILNAARQTYTAPLAREAPSVHTGRLSRRREFARELLIQATASRDLFVKLHKFQACITLLSETGGLPFPKAVVETDELLESLTSIVPSVPLLRETVQILRSYMNHTNDHSLKVGPLAYALTTVEAVIGSV